MTGDKKNADINIDHLESSRKVLSDKSKKITPWLILIPVIVGLSALALVKSPIGLFVFGGLAAVICGLIYYEKIHSPFNELKYQLKSEIIGSFMDEFHPSVEYKYRPKGHLGKNIIKASKLISADHYKEEDVISGVISGTKYYISEMHLTNQNDKSTTTVFKGLLFRLKIPDKSFPTAKIQSRLGILKQLFGSFKQNKEFGFYFTTNNERKFEHEMESFFPFISHLMKHQGDVRVDIQGDELVLMLSSEMKFLDDPKLDVGTSFDREEYFDNVGRQLNTLLFIAESFIQNLEKQEVQERLELRTEKFVLENRSLRLDLEDDDKIKDA